MACEDTIAALNEAISGLNETIAAVTEERDMLLEASMADPCVTDAVPYDLAFHVGAVFIVLVVSALGVGVILAGKRWKALQLSPFAIALGKTLGTGIILACALVHMLLPAAESLTSECVPSSVSSEYEAYAYLFALLAALGLQSIDTLIKRASIAAPLSATEPCTDVDCPSEPSLTAPGTKHTHDRSALVSLISAEFGFTVHSLFVGLAVGIVSDDELKALLVALCFHQFFEGVSLGARLIDAPTVTTAQALLYTFIFAISAPIGIGTGVGIMSAEESLNVNGETFLIVQGVFDAICAGLLLQIGFSMLINDFPTDLAKVAPKDDKYATAKVAALFVTLWGGAGAMSFLGKYL